MTRKPERSPAEWIDYIAQQELPALTSTAQLLDKFANDDVSSLPRLSKAILHDQALSTCLLKMANSIQRVGANPVTTVSRATVVLGIHSVKNICLTSKIIDSLIRNNSLSKKVFTKIKRLMATSFYAGQIAKMMLPDYNEETQEEVYLAAMLHGIGETAFWCLGQQLADELEEIASVHHSDYEQACFDLLGMTFDELTIGLASKWNLGDILIKSFNNPEERTKEMQVVYLADQLARYIDHPSDEKSFATTLSHIARITNLNERKLAKRIEATRLRSIELLTSFGAEMISDFIKPLPTISDFTTANTIEAPLISKDAQQLQLIQQLTEQSMVQKDINLLIKTTLQHLTNLLDFETCSLLLISNDKKQLSARFTYNQQHQKVGLIKVFELSQATSIINQSIRANEPLVINQLSKEDGKKEANLALKNFINKGKLVMALVKIKHNPIGIICGKKPASSADISHDDSQRFFSILQHLSLCLTMVSLRH